MLRARSDEELIDMIARKIVELKLDTIAILLLSSFGPMGRLWSQIARLYLQPLLILLGDYGELLLHILQDPNKVERLIDRIEILAQQKQ